LSAYQFVGDLANDYAGYWVSSAGEVGGDGRTDMLVGAYDNAQEGQSAGAAYLLLGGNLAEHRKINLSLPDYKFVGEEVGDFAGIQVSSPGDLDGNGLDDVLVGAFGKDTMGSKTGAAYVVPGKSLGANKTINLCQADFKIVEEGEHQRAGYAVSRAGDLDGDLDDVMVGAWAAPTGGAQLM